MIHRHLNLMFYIDTNRINAQSKLPWINILEQWDRSDIIMLGISKTAQQEAIAGSSRLRKEKAYSLIASHSLANTLDEKYLLQKIEKIIFPMGANNKNEKNDVAIVFTASKYFRILITDDGDSKNQPRGILGCADDLRNILGIQVMRDYQAVDLVNKEIIERDKHASNWSKLIGIPLPDWIGKDNIY